MHPNRETLLRSYQYDALNRLVASKSSTQPNALRFYLKDHLVTEIQGAVQRSIMQHEDQMLAQQQHQSNSVETRLLATDQQRSVLALFDSIRPQHFAYTPYGHHSPEKDLLNLPGFNGEQPDPVTGCYLLGNGFRAFNTVLMRFNSPDNWSPFGKGGLNAYAYCKGDPLNFVDPTGHVISTIISAIKKSSLPYKPPNSIVGNPDIGFSDKIARLFDGLATRTKQSFTRNESFIGPVAESRHHLGKVIERIENPPPFAQKLGTLNSNLASHGDSTLSMEQARQYGALAESVSAGKLSNTGAHVLVMGPWIKKFRSSGDTRELLGVVFNAGGALLSGVQDSALLKTGAGIRRGSFTPAP